MKTKLEQLAIELRSLAIGVENVQPDIDSRDNKIRTMTTKIKELEEHIIVIKEAAEEASRKEHWQNPATDPPPEGVKVLVGDKASGYQIATWEGVSGWFVGDTRLKQTPTRWLLIPNK
jgi:hypothetical protein